MTTTYTPAALALVRLFGLDGFAEGPPAHWCPRDAAMLWDRLHKVALESQCRYCDETMSLVLFSKGDQVRSFLRCAGCNVIGEF